MPWYLPPPFGINTITTQLNWFRIVPVAQTEEQRPVNPDHVFPAPVWLATVFGSSSFFDLLSHAFMCAACIPDAPDARTWVIWETAVRSLPSDGGLLPMMNGAPFAKNP